MKIDASVEYSYYEDEFVRTFQKNPLLVRSPGRINLIGEHTDYNGGLVLPTAIDKEMIIALAENGSDTIRLKALDLKQECEFSIDNLLAISEPWALYVGGVVDQLKKIDSVISGFDCVFGSSIPIGAGMSSSAAFECGIGFGLNVLFELGLSKKTIVQIGQRAENEFVGVNCGIMDQFANMYSKRDHVIQLDCVDLSHKYFPADFSNNELLLFDSKVKHSLKDSEYNIRRKECEAGFNLIASKFSFAKSLRDCSLEMLDEFDGVMPNKVRDRCTYVIEEIARVENACRALAKNAMGDLGQLMFETHVGLDRLYDVSCRELNVLFESARSLEGVKGARLMGGGFGGGTINLVDRNKTDMIITRINSEFQKVFKYKPNVYRVKTADGTSLIS